MSIDYDGVMSFVAVYLAIGIVLNFVALVVYWGDFVEVCEDVSTDAEVIFLAVLTMSVGSLIWPIGLFFEIEALLNRRS